jgi:hypothetical protein
VADDVEQHLHKGLEDARLCSAHSERECDALQLWR